MTILEAIITAIDNLEGVRLPIRDADNANRVMNALRLLDALRECVERQDAKAGQAGDQPEVTNQTKEDDAG